MALTPQRQPPLGSKRSIHCLTTIPLLCVYWFLFSFSSSLLLHLSSSSTFFLFSLLLHPPGDTSLSFSKSRAFGLGLLLVSRLLFRFVLSTRGIGNWAQSRFQLVSNSLASKNTSIPLVGFLSISTFFSYISPFSTSFSPPVLQTDTLASWYSENLNLYPSLARF